jgi:hypothetical protein
MTRPSASTRHSIARVFDDRVRPGHDGDCNGGSVRDDGAVVTAIGAAVRVGGRR